MSRYIPKEIVLNNLEIPVGVSILYSIWTIRDMADNTIVHYTARDEINLTSKIFTDVFEIGKKYSVVMSMVRTDGPTIDTRPLEVQVFAGDETYNLYPMPSVIDTPVITMAYAVDNVPTTDIKFTGSTMIVAGNAGHDFSNWWLTNDLNEVIWDSLKNQVNKTEIVVSGVDLKRDRFYTMHCVYIGTNRDSSGTGSITFRPNAFDELQLAGDMNNTYYGYSIDTRLKDLNTDMTLFEYKLLGDNVELVSNSNTTGEIEINNYYNGEYIGDDLGSTTNKYYGNGVVAGNGKIYYAPYNASKVLKVDPVTGMTALIGIDLGAGTYKYSGFGVLASNGMIYFPPRGANKVLKIDPNTDIVSLIGTDYGVTVDKYMQPILANNGKIYCLPYGTTIQQVLKIDPLTDTTTLVGTAITNGLSKYYSGVLASNGKIYGAPLTTNQVIALDPTTDTTTMIGTDYGTGIDKYYIGITAPNGKIYYAPYRAGKVLEIDPATNTTTLIGTDYGTTIGKYIQVVLAPNGKIYGTPHTAAQVLMIDPTTGSTTLVGPDLGSLDQKYFMGVLAPNGKIYFAPVLGTNLIQIDPVLNSITLIGLDPNNAVKYVGITIYNNILIFPPSVIRKPFKLDLTKYEAGKNSFLLETYSEYTLRLRVTTPSAVIGWKDIKFKPKKFKIESDVWDDYTYQYENKIDVLDGKILNYDKSSYNSSFTTPNGNTYQLPNGEIILLRTKTKIGRFSIDETTGVMTHLGDLYLPQMTLNKDYNIFNFKIFSTGDVLIGVGYTDYTIYQFKYDPVNNLFRYKTKYSIANGGSSTYSEMHLVGNKVIFNTDGNNGSTQDIYVIDLVTQILEQSIVDVVNGVIKGNLVRLDADDFLLRGGVKKANNGELVNTGRLLHVKNANGGVKLVGTDYTSLGITDMYRPGILASNGMIYCPPFTATKVLKINPLTGETTLIGTDLGAVVGKYGGGILASNGKIYCPPCSANKVLKIDPLTDTVSLIGTDLGASVNKYVGDPTIGANGKIYIPPYDLNKVLEIDPTTDITTLIGTDYGVVLLNKYNCSVLAPNGKIYCAPNTATNVLEINPTTGVTTLIGTAYASGTPKYGKCAIAPNGMIYGVPFGASQILKINPTTGVTTLIGPDLGTVNYKYIGIVVASGGIIYLSPFYASKILKLDTNTDTVTLVGPDMGTATAKFMNGILAGNGKIYFSPLGANKVLEIDPITSAINLIGPDLGTNANKYWYLVLSANNKIYGVPNTTRTLEIDLAGFTVDNTADSRINLPAIGITDESALQATLRNNGVVLGNFNRLKLKSNARDEVRLIGVTDAVTIDASGTILANNGMMYCIPTGTSKVIKINPTTGSSILIGMDLGAISNKYRSAILAPNGMIYCLPFNANYVLKINPNTDTVSLIGIDLGAGINKYQNGVLASNGMIYASPLYTNRVLKIDPSTDTVSLVGSTLDSTYNKYYDIVLAPNGMLYSAPRDGTTGGANKVLKINPNTDVTTFIGPDFGTTLSNYLECSVVAPNGMIYYIPYYGTNVLKIDPNTDTVTQIGAILGDTTIGSKNNKIVLLSTGIIYVGPNKLNKVLKVDTNTDTVSLVGTDYGTAGQKWYGGILAPNGMIYFIPSEATITKVLKLNPTTDTTTLIGSDLGATVSKYTGGVLAPNGKIYCPPRGMGKVLEIDPATDTTTLVGPDFGTIANKYILSGVLASNGKIYTQPYASGKVLEIDPMGISSNTFTLKKLPADKNTMTDTGSFIFKTNGGEDFKFTIYLNNGKRIFLSYSKDKPKMILYK